MPTVSMDRKVQDQHLVRQTLAGDNTAYAKLVDQYRVPIHAHIYRMLDNPRDVEDITQDAFERALRNLGSYNQGHAFSTWLYRIATNTCLDYQRKRRPELSIDAPPATDRDDARELHPSVGHTPESTYIRKQREMLMRRVIRKLSARQQLLLEMFYFEDMTYPEIATELGTNTNNVRQQLHHSRAALLKLLQTPEAQDYLDQVEYRRRNSRTYDRRLRRS